MKKGILVTGSHRSGTTWAGKIISKGKGIRYVHEPFNVGISREYSPLTFWFEYITDNSQTKHKNIVKKYLNSFRYFFTPFLLKKIKQIRSVKSLKYFFTDTIDCVFSNRTVYKDPMAIMSTEWIHKNLNLEIIILIRHPAAFIASLKVKNWQYDFSQFLKQNALMEDYLSDYEYLIRDFSINKREIIDQGILLWLVIHEVILKYQNKYSDVWHFIKHEDLSINPILEYKELFHKINLAFTSEVENYINESSNSKTTFEIEKNSTRVFNTRRNSKENIKTWKKRLSDFEIQKIKMETKKIWEKFYTEDDW